MRFLPDYTIQLKDGSKIELLFNSFMFRSYSYRKGIELEDLFVGIQTGGAFKAKDLPDLLLTAAETFCKYNDAPCPYTDLDACVWLDEIGGFNSVKLVELYKIFVSKLVNVDQKQFDVLWNKVISGAEKSESKPANGKKKATANR